MTGRRLSPVVALTLAAVQQVARRGVNRKVADRAGFSPGMLGRQTA
jgi:hypothetical protein